LDKNEYFRKTEELLHDAITYAILDKNSAKKLKIS